MFLNVEASDGQVSAAGRLAGPRSEHPLFPTRYFPHFNPFPFS
jgi:hypothetical protein